MTDAQNENGQAAPQGNPQGTMPIAINSQYVKDFSFENPNAPGSFTTLKQAPDVQVSVNVEARKMADEVYEVTLNINAQATDSEKKPLFVTELSYGALTTLKDVPEESVQPILLIEVPRIIFPFARNILADITRDGGYPPLMVNPVDFVALYRQGIQNKEAMKNAPVEGTA